MEIEIPRVKGDEVNGDNQGVYHSTEHSSRSENDIEVQAGRVHDEEIEAGIKERHKKPNPQVEE